MTRPADRYDLVVAGGRVVDPANGRDEPADVAVRDGAIAAVGRSLRAGAREVIDAAGCLVTPGLVDAHTHLDLAPGPWGVDPQQLVQTTGATTWVDAGSAGAARIAELREAARGLPLEVRALLHVSMNGLDVLTGESAHLSALSVGSAIDAAAAHPGFVVGVKVRIDRRTVGELGLEPLRRAVTVARTTALPLMVHVGYAPPAVADVAPLLERGDILTHCASGTPDDILVDGALAPHILAAHERGVLFDIGHGNGSFAFEVLDAYLAHGIVPICSSDINARSWSRGGATLPDVMSKMLASGVPVEDVIDASTRRPAAALGLPTGTLAVGARADLTVLRLVQEERPLTDTAGVSRVADRLIVPVTTVVAGIAPAGQAGSDRGADQPTRPSIEG